MLQPKLQTDTPVALATNLYKAILALAVVTPLIVLVAVTLNFVGDITHALPGVWGVGLSALAVGSAFAKDKLKTWLYIFAALMLLVTLAWLFGPFLADKRTAVLVFGGVAGVFLWQLKRMVLNYAAYCQAHIDIPAATAPPAIDFWPTYTVALGHFAIFLVFKSPTATLVLTAALTAIVLLQGDLKGNVTLCINVVHVWSDARADLHESAWRPSLKKWQRIGTLFIGILAIATTFIVATSYGSAFDKWGQFEQAEFSKPFAWLYLPVKGLITQPPHYRWCLAQGVVLTLTMPLAILASILMPSLRQIRKWEETAKQPSDKSDLDKLLEKTP